MRQRNFYLAVQLYGSTRYSLSGFDVELHAFDKLSERDAYYNQLKKDKPYLFVCRLDGRAYLRDKYYHRAVIVYNCEMTIRHYQTHATKKGDYTKMKLNIRALVDAAFLAMAQTRGDRIEIARIQVTRKVTIYLYAYRDLCGRGNEIDLMLESASGRSYDPIRYTDGRIAYDFPASKKTMDATRRAYDFLLSNGLRAHSDYINVE